MARRRKRCADASACGAVATLDASACHIEKLLLPMCMSCFNDGYVEICVDSNDVATLCAVAAIAPDREVLQGFGGRLGCTTQQTLVLIPMHKERDCLERYGMPTDAAWAKICAIAGLANVAVIGPTFFP